MKKELYINICADCHFTFRTDDPAQKVCPTCLAHRNPSGRGRKRKQKKVALTFAEILHIANVYAKVKHKYIHYGDLVALIERNAEHCVCCGAVVPEGRQVCPNCEKAGGL